VEGLIRFIAETWGEPLIDHAWEDFWNYDRVPDDLPTTPEFDSMFIPWLVLGFVPDPEADEADPDWPRQPIGLEWLARTDLGAGDLDRTYIEMACRSPMSALAVEHVEPGRSLDLKDVLTGARFHVLEQTASQNVRPADLLFTRVVTIGGVSLMFGAAPFVVPPHWHTYIIDWRERLFRKRLMTLEDLARFESETRELYFTIVADMLAPTPPQLTNTDGDPLALTTLTYELHVAVGEAFEKVKPLAGVHGDDHVDEVTRDGSGAMATACLSWIGGGNRQHTTSDTTILGALRLEPGRLVADVNSAQRAARLKRELARRLGKHATLIDTAVVDPSGALPRPNGAEADAQDERAADASPELRAVEEDMRRQEWADWLDTRVPALGNRTPRQAARTVAGRERLEALLDRFEREAEHGPADLATHLATIRSALALEKSRG